MKRKGPLKPMKLRNKFRLEKANPSFRRKGPLKPIGFNKGQYSLKRKGPLKPVTMYLENRIYKHLYQT